MGKAIPQTIKDHAMSLFIKGDMTAREIAEIVSTKEHNVKPVTIYAWAKRGNWSERSAVERSDQQQKIIKNDGQRFARIQERQLNSYTKLAEKAEISLDSMEFERPFEAARAMDMGIKGQREVMQGMVNLQFVQDVLAVIIEEVNDSEMLNRISIKFKSLIQQQGNNE
tara:strand:- start:1524 stop:2027 length:504 start_codon:yes stop_codon:yes gene_type:complete